MICHHILKGGYIPSTQGISTLLIVCRESGMVNLHNPLLSAGFGRASDFATVFRISKRSIILFFDSHFCKDLARNEWYLLVSLHLFLFIFVSCYIKLFCPAGSSLLHLTMNGGFFGAAFPTDTVYGSVTIAASPESRPSRVNLLVQ